MKRPNQSRFMRDKPSAGRDRRVFIVFFARAHSIDEAFIGADTLRLGVILPLFLHLKCSIALEI